jgi:hypothetical protein
MTFDKAIFECVEKIVAKNGKMYNVTVFDVYGEPENGEDFNAKLMKTYFWILGHPLSQQLQHSPDSLVTSQEQIMRVLKTVTKHLEGEEHKFEDRKSVALDANFVYRYDRDMYILPYYIDQPPCHELYDRVVCLNHLAPPFYVQFGMLGTIIGIFGNKFEILLDEPFIGGTNLNNRCPWFRVSSFTLTDSSTLHSG